MSFLDDLIEEFFEHFVAFLVTSYATHGHDEGMPWVVNSSLDDIVKIDTILSLEDNHSLIHILGEDTWHPVVVFGEVWVAINLQFGEDSLKYENRE